MHDSLKYIIGFVVGGSVGFLASRLYYKKKYAALADEEIESVRKYYNKKQKTAAQKKDENPPKPDIADYINAIASVQRKEEMEAQEAQKIKEYGAMFRNTEVHRSPYVITPDEYDELTEYEKVTLQYFSDDGILADDNNFMVEDVDELVGTEWESRFGEYNPGVVYVRNDARQCDYEILLVQGTYSEE